MLFQLRQRVRFYPEVGRKGLLVWELEALQSSDTFLLKNPLRRPGLPK